MLTVLSFICVICVFFGTGYLVFTGCISDFRESNGKKSKESRFECMLKEVSAYMDTINKTDTIIDAQKATDHALLALRKWYPTTEIEYEKIITTKDTVDSLCSEKIKEIEQKTLQAVISEEKKQGLFIECLYIITQQWIDRKITAEQASTYFKEILNEYQSLGEQDATSLLLAAEENCKMIFKSVIPSELAVVFSLISDIKASKLKLRERIEQKRKEAFSDIIDGINKIEKKIDSAETTQELVNIQKTNETLISEWGLLNNDEQDIWKEKEQKINRKLLDRNTHILNIQSNTLMTSISNQMTEICDKIAKCESITQMQSIETEINSLNGISTATLNPEDQKKMSELVNTLTIAKQKKEIELMETLKRTYNTNSVRIIDDLQQHISESNTKDDKLYTEFATINTSLLEPAILQYYQIIVAFSLEKMDQENAKLLMEMIAQTPKSGLGV